MKYLNQIIKHYETNWNSIPKQGILKSGPMLKLAPNFKVLEFEPTAERDMWTYATCGMSCESDLFPIELHIFSSSKDSSLLELLTIASYYHVNTNKLNLGHTINLGKPWKLNSKCDYALISLPYLDGPKLEKMYYSESCTISFYWLIPVTKNEVDFKISNGLELLEDLFEKKGLDYLNPNRPSCV